MRPVREGVLAILCLPSDLTVEEAGRLDRYVESLAIAAPPAGEPGVMAGADLPTSANGR